MTDVSEGDRQRAAELADQIESMGPAMTYRTLAAALAEERAKARAPYKEAIDAVLAYCDEIDEAEFFPGLADTDAIRTRLGSVDVVL